MPIGTPGISGQRPAGGGVSNTGNAAVGDVASGKTFSSALLTNATGTSVAGNATVPDGTAILPVQAFVDVMVFIAEGVAGVGGQIPQDLHFENLGITHFATPADPEVDQTLLGFLLAGAGLPHLYLNGNALPAADIDGILYAAKYNFTASGSLENGLIDLSGGTNAAPTEGMVNDEFLALGASAWTMKINIHGHVVTWNYGSGFIATGNSFSAAEVNALLAAMIATYSTLAAVLNLSGGTSAAPTGQGVVDKAALISAGWTVTTN